MEGVDLAAGLGRGYRQSLQTDLPPEVAKWREAIRGMSTDRSPCYRLSAERWRTMHEAALDFIERFGAEAHRLGRTTADLFSVHPEHGTLRIDYCGALMVSSNTAVGVDAHRILFGASSAYRGVPGKPQGVPIWEYAADGRKARSDP